MTTLAIVQARTSSTRLPSKVLLPIGTKPMVLFQLERLKRCTRLDRLVLATSDDSSDDLLANVVSAAGFKVFRGDLSDVLDRSVPAQLRNRPQQLYVSPVIVHSAIQL